jgi:hypothetical protein
VHVNTRHANRSAKLVALLTAIGALAPTTALAADKAACLSAYDETQKLKKSGKLLEAKKRSLICAQDGCPTVVRDDCTAWSVELDKTIPSMVLVVTDAEGRDVTDAVAYLDGSPVSAHVEGKAIQLDPGTHKLRLEREGYDTIEQDVVAHEGDKNRSVNVKFPARPGDEPPTAVAPTPEPAGAMAPAPIPTAAWVFAGLGVVGLAGFATFGLLGNAKKGDLDDARCKPTCAADDVDAAKRDYLIADIALGVSVVSLGIATVLVLTRGEQPVTTTGKIPSMGVAVTSRGASASLAWSF